MRHVLRGRSYFIALAVTLGLAAGASTLEAARLAAVAAGVAVGKRGVAAVTAGEVLAALATSG